MADTSATANAAPIADGGLAGLPPVHLWSPSHCGDIGLSIGRDGSWRRDGSPILRERLVRLFSRILRKDDDGLHYLVTPHEKVLVAVETAPFLAVAVEALGDGADRRLRFTTNVGDVVDAGADRPIRVETDPATGEPSPFVLVRARLEALMTRAVFFELVELTEPDPKPDGSTVLSVRSRGASFPLGTIPAEAA